MINKKLVTFKICQNKIDQMTMTLKSLISIIETFKIW